MQGTRFLHHFFAFVSKNEANSCAPVQSRTGCWAFYARFECTPTRFTLFEFLWWRLKHFIVRFTPDCVQKNPLTFLFLLYSPLASSSLQYSQFTFCEQVIDVSTSKTGKHGHAKCHFVAEDIFTGKRCDELVPAGHNLEVPVVSKAEYTLLDIDDDDHMSLMDEKGDTREDLKLPDDRSGDSAFALGQEVQKKFDEGAEVVVTIMSAMGIDQLSAWKEAAN